MRHILAVSGCACLLLFISPAWSIDLTSCPAQQPASNMKLTFDSEFARDGVLNSGQWRPYVGQHGTPNQELEVYIPGEVKVMPTVGLRLQTDKQNYWQHQYTSGEVTTQGLFSQTYGHFEILAKMPEANGFWPAFWLLPENGGWPPEIDVVEYIYAPLGALPSALWPSNPQTSLHWANPDGSQGAIGQGSNSLFPRFSTFADWNVTPPLPGLGSSYAGYHTYAVDWRPGSLVYLIDSNPVLCIAADATTGQRVPNIPMFMILNDAITAGTAQSPGWPGYVQSNQTFPVYFDIAYARAYQFNNLAPPPMPLDVQNVRLSNPNPAPGQTVGLYADVHVGPYDLGSGNISFIIYNFINPQQYQGMLSTVAAPNVSMLSLKANQTYTVEVPYTVPTTEGIYGINPIANYTAGPGEGPSGSGWRGLYMQQAQTFQVISPGPMTITNINLTTAQGGAVSAVSAGSILTLSGILNIGSKNLSSGYVDLKIFNSQGKMVAIGALSVPAMKAYSAYPVKTYVYTSGWPSGTYTALIAASFAGDPKTSYVQQTGPSFTVK